VPGGMVCAIDLITGFGYICGMAENQAGTVWHPTLLDQVDSTQDWVRRNLSHLPDRSVVTACSQSVGKGRLGRGWVSPPGGLYSSILFRPAPVPEFAPRVSLAMAAVLVRSLQSSGVPSLVKWPNDVLAGGGKIAGIIAEAGGHPEPWLILGVGVNLSCAPVVPGRSILPAVHFIDSTVPLPLLENALPLLEERGHRFFGFTRATKEFLKPSLLNRMARSGCSMLQWGIESGSPAILERFGKGIDPETAQMVLKESAARGIRNYAYFLFSLPGETGRDREMTLDFIEEAGTAISFMNASVFNLPVDSELTERQGEFGMKLGTYDPGTDAIRLYSPFTCENGDPRTEAKKFLWEAGRRSPVFSGLISATPKWFRATHMAFMEPAARL